MKETVTLSLVYQDPGITQFMQAFDVFEPFKVGVLDFRPYSFTVKLPPGEFPENLWPQWLEVVHAYGKSKLIAAWVLNRPQCCFRDEKVRVISNGRKWALFNDMLRAYEYPGNLP